LSYYDAYKDDQEQEIVEETLENVPFVADLAGRDHVADLHQHEHSEDEGHVPRRTIVFVFSVLRLTPDGVCPAWVDEPRIFKFVPPLHIWLDDEPLSEEHADKQPADHVDTFAKDVLHHFARYNIVFSVLGWSEQQFFPGHLSGESECGK
jgi:hypothetical protein